MFFPSGPKTPPYLLPCVKSAEEQSEGSDGFIRCVPVRVVLDWRRAGSKAILTLCGTSLGSRERCGSGG